MTQTDNPDQKPVSVPRVPWNPWLGLVYVLLVFVGSQIVADFVLNVITAITHKSLADFGNSTLGQFIFVAAAEIVAIWAIYLFIKAKKTGLAIIGLRRPQGSDFLYGLAAVPVYYLIYLTSVSVVSHFVPGLNVNQQQDIGFNNVQGAVDMVLAFVSLVVLPPIAEEIMVRGFLYSSLKKGLPAAGAVILTSALFAAAHLPEGGSSGLLYIAALDTFVLSLVLIYLREKTGGLWASITLHACKNGIAFLALFAWHIK